MQARSRKSCISDVPLAEAVLEKVLAFQTREERDRPLPLRPMTTLSMHVPSSVVSKANVVRVFAADTAVAITNKAIELMGSNGLSPEYHLEKYFRDSKITQTILAGQQVSLYRVIRGYYDYVIQ